MTNQHCYHKIPTVNLVPSHLKLIESTKFILALKVVSISAGKCKSSKENQDLSTQSLGTASLF
jgi:hypothetical protein